jgi:ferredoxin--NADP+ reductase
MNMSRKPVPLQEHTLTGNSEIAPGVHLITFRRPWNFISGQVVKIALDQIIPPRIYSLCSGNHDKEAAILFNIKEDGLLTPKLASMIPGEKILVSEPYGSFLGTDEPAWWISTGTGIAPFFSMLRSGLGENKKLIHGVSFLNQFYFEDELEQALGGNYIRCCSRESSCNTFPGRVSDYISGLEQLPDVRYFLCGKALMVVEMRDLLISKGIPFDNILAEIYF